VREGGGEGGGEGARGRPPQEGLSQPLPCVLGGWRPSDTCRDLLTARRHFRGSELGPLLATVQLLAKVDEPSVRGVHTTAITLPPRSNFVIVRSIHGVVMSALFLSFTGLGWHNVRS
jgi:hypothetical protein